MSHDNGSTSERRIKHINFIFILLLNIMAIFLYLSEEISKIYLLKVIVYYFLEIHSLIFF